MIQNAPVALPQPPKFHESSSLRSPRDSDNTARIWKRAKIINNALKSSQNATAQNARAIDKLRRRSLPSPPPGLQWQLPDKELDPTRAVSVGTLVCISPNNPLVTTGLKDLVSGNVTKSTAGTWCCVKNVPAQVTISSVVNYNVPVSPVPGAPGTPSGSPLAGDFDATNVFWVPIGTAAAASQNAELFAITTLSNADYVTAVPITIGTSTGLLQISFGSSINIAKHNRMRVSVGSELIDGVTITYTAYTADNQRSASDGTNSEYQVAFPRYTTAGTLGLSTSSPITGALAYSFLTSQCVIKALPITSPVDDTTTWPVWEEVTPRVWSRSYTLN